MRGFFVAFWMFCSTVTATAQACGYTFLTVYLKGSDGTTVTNAEVQTFEADFRRRDLLHFPRDEEWPDHLSRRLGWSEEKQAFYGSEGLCGGHRNVGLRVSAKGFEIFDKIIDLPLGWTSYAITLRRSNSVETSSAIKLAHVRGDVKDKTGAIIPAADIVVVGANGQLANTSSTDPGRFELDVPVGNYKVVVLKSGFKRLTITNFEVAEPKWEFLDLTLNVRACDDCNGDMGHGEKVNRTEEIIDYQLLKRKNDNN